MAKFPLHPQNPERICWGCEKFCPADDMCCGNGTIRAPHPCELMGDDWHEWLQKQEHPDAEADRPFPPASRDSRPGLRVISPEPHANHDQNAERTGIKELAFT
jgi:hypothetical protein